MSTKQTMRAKRLPLWKGAVGVFLLAMAPCDSSLQHPPANTELFWGVSIATGAEIPAVPASDAQTELTTQAADLDAPLVLRPEADDSESALEGPALPE